MKLTFSIAAFIVMLSAIPVTSYAQRCGGDLTYFPRNIKGEIMDEEKIDLTYVQNSKAYFPKDLITHDGGQTLGSVYLGREKQNDDWVKILRFSTGCGVAFIEIELEHEDQSMLIRFLNIPAEMNFFVDSIPFQRGTYEMDFKSDMSFKFQKLNRDGLTSKAGNNFLRGAAQIGHVVSAENWIRSADQKRRTGKLAKPVVER